MSKVKDFYDKPIFTIPSYIYNLFLGGFYFIICNPLLIIFYTVTFINPNYFNLFLLFISLIPLGPSLGALYSTMGELHREKSISITSSFFSSYKNNFIDNIKPWILELSILLLLFIDFQFFYINKPQLGLHIVFAILGLFVLLLSLSAFPISARFKLKIKDLFLLSFYYSIKRLPVTILKITVLLVLIKFAVNLPGLLFVFLPSCTCFLFTYYDTSMLKEIEKNNHDNKLNLI